MFSRTYYSTQLVNGCNSNLFKYIQLKSNDLNSVNDLINRKNYLASKINF